MGRPFDMVGRGVVRLTGPGGAGEVFRGEVDPDHQPLLSLMLRKADAEVSLAENGQVAIDLASAARNADQPFDLIVMDVQMPVLDGFAATRNFRAAGFDMPIIALTARSFPAECLGGGKGRTKRKRGRRRAGLTGKRGRAGLA